MKIKKYTVEDLLEKASSYLNLSMLFTNVSASFLYIVLGLNFVNIIENIVLSLGCLVISLYFDLVCLFTKGSH